ncbi:hypothetical protein ABE530_05890 [Brucella sp. TWI559]
MIFHRILLAIGSSLLAVSSSAYAQNELDQSTVALVARALELPYTKIYPGSVCRDKLFDGEWFLKCAPRSGSVTGGLWLVAPGPVLVAVNGKAIQQMEKLSPVVMDDLSVVATKDWRAMYPDRIADIGAVLDAYK